jgi:hypothetical protein
MSKINWAITKNSRHQLAKREIQQFISKRKSPTYVAHELSELCDEAVTQLLPFKMIKKTIAI